MKKTTPGIVPGTALDVNESTCLTTTSLDFILMLVPPFANSPFWPPNWNTDPQCWKVFYRHAINKALNYMKYDWSLAEDAVQEAAIYCTENYGKIHSDPKSWCLEVVRNKSIDLIRKRNRKSLTLVFFAPSHDDFQGNSTPNPLELAADQSPTLDQAAEKLDESELIKCMLNSLEPKVRHVFESHYINEESQVDIAARLQMTENAVKCRLNRVRINLRKQFCKEITALQFINA